MPAAVTFDEEYEWAAALDAATFDTPADWAQAMRRRLDHAVATGRLIILDTTTREAA